MKYNRAHILLILLFIAFAVIYMLQTLHISSTDPGVMKYNLSDADAIKLSLTVAVPLMLIWAAGLIGYINLSTYAKYINEGNDGQAIRNIARGVLLLLLWLPVVSIMNRFVKDISVAHPQYSDIANQVSLFVNILILLWGYVLLHRGAKQNWYSIRPKDYRKTFTEKLLPYLFGMFALVYVAMVFWNSVPGGRTVLPYLPDWAVFLGVVTPRLIMWFFGLQAVWYVYKYARCVHGKIYRQSFHYLALGLAMLTLCLIFVGYLATLNSLSKNLELSSMLAIVYVLLVVMAAGYAIMAVGASRLKRIEQA